MLKMNHIGLDNQSGYVDDILLRFNVEDQKKRKDSKDI